MIRTRTNAAIFFNSNVLVSGVGRFLVITSYKISFLIQGLNLCKLQPWSSLKMPLLYKNLECNKQLFWSFAALPKPV